MSYFSETIARIKQSLDVDGFYLYERFLQDSNFLDDLGDSLLRIYRATDGIESTYYSGTVHFLLGRDPSFLELLEDRRLHEIVYEIMGIDVRIHSYNGLVVEPGSSMVQQEIHRDGKVCSECGRSKGFQILIFLDDYTKENGAIRLLKKNDNYLRELNSDEFDKDSILIEGPSGSVLFFETGIWHASGQNLSATERKAITLVYFEKDVSPQIDFSSALSDDLKDCLSKDVKDLIGLNTVVPKNIGEFYLNAMKNNLEAQDNG